MIVLIVSTLILSCNTGAKTNAFKKAQIDAILRGEELPLYSLPKYSEEEGSGDTIDPENQYALRPYWAAKELGYSEEDLEKLKNLVVRLSSPKTAEKQH